MIEFSAKAKKGAIVRELLYSIREKVGRIGNRPEVYADAANAARRAANLIANQAPRGSEIHVKIMIEDDALGGTNTVLMVDVAPAVKQNR